MQPQHSSKSATTNPRPSRFGTHLEVPGQSIRQSARPPVVGTSGMSARPQAAGSGYKPSGAHLDGARSSQTNNPAISAARLQAPSAQRTSTTRGVHAPSARNAPASYRSDAARSFHSNAATGTSRGLPPTRPPVSSSYSSSSSQQRPTGAVGPLEGQRGMAWKIDAKPLAPLRPGEKRQYMEVVTTTARIVQERRD